MTADESGNGGLLQPGSGEEELKPESKDPGGMGGISLPPEMAHLQGFIQNQFAMYQGAVPNPILNKVNEKHIDKALDLAKAEQDQQFELQRRDQDTGRSNRAYAVAAIVLALGFVLILLWLLGDKPDVLGPVLAGTAGLAAGWAGGYGYGKSKIYG